MDDTVTIPGRSRAILAGLGAAGVWIGGFLSWAVGGFRPAEFGPTPRMLTFEIGSGLAIGFGIWALLRAAVPKHAFFRRFRSAALWVIVSLFFSLATEVRCVYEEAAFRREALAAPGTSYGRARWWPFGDCGLIYDRGEFRATD